MDDGVAQAAGSSRILPRLDLQEHLADLEAKNLLRRIDHPVNKDTELHPLVRLQFLGGIPDAERRAFLFTNVIDASGRRYDMPVVVGLLRPRPQSIRSACAARRTTSASPGSMR